MDCSLLYWKHKTLFTHNVHIGASSEPGEAFSGEREGDTRCQGHSGVVWSQLNVVEGCDKVRRLCEVEVGSPKEVVGRDTAVPS